MIPKTSHIQLLVDTTKQTLSVHDGDELIRRFDVSTAKNGTGQLENSGCTPLGRHVIAEKIGGIHPMNAVFVGRMFTGEFYDDNLGAMHPDRDWILGRILWLQGLDQGVNLGEDLDGICCDTHARYIYIHGTPDTQPMGVPMSHGCIRMRLDEIVWLYDVVSVGTQVYII